MKLKDKQAALLEDLSYIPNDREHVLGYIMDLGKGAEKVPEDCLIDTFRVDGCMSQLWVVPEFREGLCYYRSESDSLMVKGMASLLCDFYSEAKPDEIIANDASFLSEVGISDHLTSNRRNGLSNLVSTIQRFAKSCMAES